uniref:Putative L-type lectin-domain containing receptor kinase IX.1 n=1 Tax=Davidia involucrata TaxID=16924 RepID=A0A5B7BWN4_DAVIN
MNTSIVLCVCVLARARAGAVATYACNLPTSFTSPRPQITLFFSLFSFFLLPFANANSVDFRIPRFDPNAANILYEEDAIPSVGTVEFNYVNYLCRVGRATSKCLPF